MNKLSVLGALFSLATIVVPARAAPVTQGPYKDFKGNVITTVTVTVNTSLTATLSIPFDGTLSTTITDFASVSVSVTTPVYVPTYVTVQTSAMAPFNKNTDSVVLTDIYAKDLNPLSDTPVVLTGFNQFAPEMTLLTPETFVGVSGTNYPATLSTVSTLANLPSLLPGFDLSEFTGDPNSIVYVNQATLPATDVPEPAGCILIGAGALALALVGCRRR